MEILRFLICLWIGWLPPTGHPDRSHRRGTGRREPAEAEATAPSWTVYGA